MTDSLEARLSASLGARYRLERELGAGRMARVWQAQDLRHGSTVAIKVMRPEVSARLGGERFLREIQITARLAHPHILPLLDSGEVDGLLYYVMPYASGGTVRDRLQSEGRLPAAEALRLGCEVADALHFAHRNGVVHRDLKPENILLQDRHAVVADFGIALALDHAAESRMTEPGTTVGTPAYMSPEQAAGEQDVDARSDVYSLGCVLYELLAGEPPFTADTAANVLRRHLTATPRPVTDFNPALPNGVAIVLDRALAKSPKERHQTAEELGTDLALLSTGGGVPGAASRRPADGPARRRSRGPAVTLALVAILVLAALAIWKGPDLLRRSGLLAPTNRPPRSWMLAADFEGPPEDPGLAGATRALVMAALDQSEVVTTVPPEQIRVALRAAGRPDTTRLAPDLARELAFRTSVRTILAGQVHRLGNGYGLVLRVVDVERDSLLLALDETARTESDLIPAVERVTRRLRARLGERRDAIRATRPVQRVITPSFEAYRKLEQARVLVRRGRFPENHHAALRLMREALALDPDCATGYARMGGVFMNLGLRDSSEWAYRQALERPERLDEFGRLLITSNLAELRGDAAGALAACDAVLARDSAHTGGWNRRTVLMARAGRLDEAVRSAEQQIRLQAFGPNEASLHNLFFLSIQAGDADRAAAALGRMRVNNLTRVYGPVWVALCRGHRFEAESLAVALLARRDTPPFARWYAARALAGEHAARGQLAEAARLFAEARAVGVSVEGAEPGRLEERAQLLLAHASGLGHPPPTPAFGRDTTAALISMGLRSAIVGDTTRAREQLQRLRTRPARDLAHHGAGPAVLEALVALRAGRSEEAVRLLAPVAREEDERGEVRDRVGRQWPRWLVAEAWEQAGEVDSAARYYELATSRGNTVWFGEARMLASLAHLRLVSLYARNGRTSEAERHWRIVSETLIRPDPDLAPRLEEARAALMAARGMGGARGR